MPFSYFMDVIIEKCVLPVVAPIVGDLMLNQPDTRMALQAYEKILDMIMSRQLKPGGLIQERRLADHLQMSRTPVRDALLMLEGEGLLVRSEGRGLQVRFMDIKDFVDNLAVRELMEPEAARLSIGNLDQAALKELEIQLEELLVLARSGGPAPERDLVRNLDQSLHDMVAVGSGNAQIANIIRMLRNQTKIFDVRSIPQRLEATCLEHIEIIQALKQGHADAAAAAMRKHLAGVRRSIISHLAGV